LRPLQEQQALAQQQQQAASQVAAPSPPVLAAYHQATYSSLQEMAVLALLQLQQPPAFQVHLQH
jgi:hypothetical protein